MVRLPDFYRNKSIQDLPQTSYPAIAVRIKLSSFKEFVASGAARLIAAAKKTGKACPFLAQNDRRPPAGPVPTALPFLSQY
ncbi:MAG: hypothetical protein AB7F96_05815 [Beijerinckiaceae bacterium]